MNAGDLQFSAFDVAFQAALPIWLLIALAVATLLALGLSAWRADRGFGLRLLAVTVLWLLLLDPTLVEEERRGLPDIVLALVDDSESQAIGDRTAQTDLALAALRERAATWPDAELRVLRLSQKGDEGSLVESEDGTRMFGALRRALVDVPRGRLAGVVMLSDGQIHDAPELASEIGIDAPLHVLLTGARNEGDRRLTVTKAPRYGLVGKPQSIMVRVDDLLPENAPPSRRVAELTIRQDGGEPSRLLMPLGEERPVDFTLRHGGQTVIELSVEQGPSELSLANNRALVTVNGVRDRLRVLLVSGEPHAGERAWRNLLKSDPAVDLVHFTILRPPEKQDGTPINELSLIAFPIRELFEVKLDEFDLVIFDRYRRRGVLPRLYMRNLARYVESGGALLDAVGPTYAGPLTLYRTPLGLVLPGEPTGTIWARSFRPLVTDLGHRHPVTAGLTGSNPPASAEQNAQRDETAPSWGPWFRQIEVSARRGVTLMTGAEDRPLLILDRVGDGRVAQVLSDQMWLWARGYDGGGPQAELMRRLAHWLMKEPDLEENDLRAQVSGDGITITRRSLEPIDRPVTVTAPDGSTREVRLESTGQGLERARIATDTQGLFVIEDGDRRVLTVVGPINPLEQRDFRATDAVMRPFVTANGGGILWVSRVGSDGLEEAPRFRRVRADRDMAGDGWIGFRENRASVVTGIVEAPLMPAALALVLALTALIAAWRREGR